MLTLKYNNVTERFDCSQGLALTSSITFNLCISLDITILVIWLIQM